MEFTPEALGERAARRADQLLDALETKLAQALDIGGREAQRRDRQQRDRLAMRARLDGHRPPRRHMAGDRMRASGSVGHRNLERQPKGGDAPVQILDERALAAEQRGAARDIEPEAIGRIGRDHRGITLSRPERETAQPVDIGFGVGVDDVEFGRERARPGDGHAHHNAERARVRARRRDDPAAMVGDRGNERAGGARGVRPRLAGLPAQPVGRPVRQEERYDPSHRTPPISIDAGCRRAPARDRRASVVARGSGCRDPRSGWR